MIYHVTIDGAQQTIDMSPVFDPNLGVSAAADYAGALLANVTVWRAKSMGTYYALKRTVLGASDSSAASRNEQLVQADERYAQARQDREALDTIYEMLMRVVCPRLRMKEAAELELPRAYARS